MKTFLNIFIQTVSYFFILLFIYASVSKIVDFENFQVQIGQSPLLSAYAGFISYAVIITELIIVLLLLIQKTNLLGLYASTALMSAFTIYIYLILNYSDFVPCSCGGILEKLGWTEHLIFNICCIILGIVAVVWYEGNPQITTRKKSVVLAATNVLSIAVVVLLFISSEHIIKKENNFTRRFLMYPVSEDKNLNLESKNHYFAGEDQQNIYLGNKEFPQILTIISKDFKNISTLKITPERFNFLFKNLNVQVKFPYYYISDGTVPVIYRGKLGNPDAKLISFQDAFFSQLVIKDSTQFFLRSINSKTKSLTVVYLNTNNYPTTMLLPQIIEKQKDGVFDSDGQLKAADDPFRLFYLYSYRNQFTVAKNEWNSFINLKTIDTVQTAKIKTKKLSDGRHKMIAPPLKVNQNISVQGNLAFINSALRGKNESFSSWKKSKVIDIYTTDHQEYIGSFHVYNHGDETMNDYFAGKNFFYTLSGNRLVRYKYRNPLIKHLKTGEAENLNSE